MTIGLDVEKERRRENGAEVYNVEKIKR